MGEWISVEDRLPEEYEDVLVTDGVEVALGFFVMDPEYPQWDYAGHCVRGLETHWQPLPEPPQ